MAIDIIEPLILVRMQQILEYVKSYDRSEGGDIE